MQPATGFPRLAFFFEVPMGNRKSRLQNGDDSAPFERIYRAYPKDKHRQLNNRPASEEKFRCMNCSLMVTAEHELSGVNNRNHCPNCLWSKHVDLYKAGDRKAACRSRMRPLGLTVKRIDKRYGGSGELMIIHRCVACGKVSINRIAADDSAGALLALYTNTQNMESSLLQTLSEMDIVPLQAADLTTVYSQLFGWQSILGEFTPPPEVLTAMEAMQQSLKNE